MTVQLEERILDTEDVAVEENVIDDALADADVVVVPTRIVDGPGGQQLAAYSREVGDLRRFARGRGVRLGLATPRGMDTAAYEEHDDSWVVPLVVFASDYSLAMSAQFMHTWIMSFIGGTPREDARLVVRFGRKTTKKGTTITTFEAKGRAPDVLAALREVADAPEED